MGELNFPSGETQSCSNWPGLSGSGMQYTKAGGGESREKKVEPVVPDWTDSPATVPSSSALSSRMVISMGVLEPGAITNGSCSRSIPPMVAAATYPREECRRNQ